MLSVCLFLLVKNKEFNWSEKTKKILYNITENGFGIYLIHPFFINIIYKVIKITPLDCRYPVLSIPLFVVLFFVLSYLFTWIARKIKPIKRYIL